MEELRKLDDTGIEMRSYRPEEMILETLWHNRGKGVAKEREELAILFL